MWVILGRFGLVGLYGTLFWVDRGEWEWVWHYFGLVGVGGDEWSWRWVVGALFDNVHIFRRK